MLTIIGYLLILLTALLGTQDIPGQNILLNAGILVLTAYVCGKLATSFRVPAVVGYITAGVLIGKDGIGLISAGYTERTQFIVELLFMVLIAQTVRFVLKPQPPKHSLRVFSAGILASILVFIITFGFVASLTVSFQLKVIISLFAASFSPIIISRFNDDEAAAQRLLLMSFGGYAAATVLWGVITPFMDPSVTEKIRLASMPVFIAVLSMVTGIVWGFISEKCLLITTSKVNSVFPVAVMFLIYPLVHEFGLDNIYLAIGIGIFNGLLSERPLSTIEQSDLPALIVFSYFGMQISLQNMFLISNTSWSLIAIVIAVLLITRFFSAKITSKVIPRTSRNIPFIVLLSLGGPLTITHLRRFLPGYATVLPKETSIFLIFTVFSSVMFFLALCFGILIPFLKTRQNTSTHDTIEI